MKPIGTPEPTVPGDRAESAARDRSGELDRNAVKKSEADKVLSLEAADGDVSQKEESPGNVETESEPTLRVVSFVHRDGRLLETVYRPENQWPMQLKSHMGKPRNFGSSIGPTVLNPPVLDDMVRSRVVLLPSTVISNVAQADLVSRLIRFVHRYLDVPAFWEKMIAHYVLMSWVYDRFSAVPYLRLVAEHGTGKSRFLQAVGALCYKSVICGGSISVSSIFRLTDKWRGTVVLDECDFNHSSEWTEIVRLLNCGYMDGMPAVRSDSIGRSFEPRAFQVFGPKILASRHRFTDSALESRCLTYTPEERKLREDIPRQLPSVFWDQALDLRNQLLGWRFEKFDILRVDESPLRHLDPRLAQIGTPLYNVSTDQAFQKEFLEFLVEFGQEDRAERPQSLVVEALRHCMEVRDGGLEVVNDLIAAGDPAAANFSGDPYLTVKGITEQVNYYIKERGGNPMAAKRVGGILRSLGFKPQRARDGYRFTPDPKRVEELVEKYVPRAEG